MNIPTRWIVTFTVVMVAVFAGSGWAARGVATDVLGRELVLIAANTLPLLALRRNPLLVAFAFGVTYPMWVAFGHPVHELQSLPTVAAMFAVGAWDRALRVRATALVLPVWMVLGGSMFWMGDVLELVYVGVFFVVVWAIGVVLADRHTQARALEIRTRELEAAREELADRAVADERARIARELHDVLAHAMSVITVQAGVGAHVVDRRPEQASEALAVIERTGREALEEMRRMLLVLREPDETDGLPDPQPTLTDLPSLVEQVRRSGVQVALTVEGTDRTTSPGLALALYRVVQEALTNAAKHAPGCRVDVTISHHPTAIDVEVVNDLPHPSDRGDTASFHDGDGPSPAASGHGLRGMGERVALYGGDLETTEDEATFRVRARFPIEEAAS
jgi:signal transduction histidine kinase